MIGASDSIRKKYDALSVASSSGNNPNVLIGIKIHRAHACYDPVFLKIKIRSCRQYLILSWKQILLIAIERNVYALPGQCVGQGFWFRTGQYKDWPFN